MKIFPNYTKKYTKQQTSLKPDMSSIYLSSCRSPRSPTDTLAFSSTQLSCHEPTLLSLPLSNFLTFLIGKMDATPNTNLIPDYNDDGVSLSSSSSASSASPTSQFVKKVQRQIYSSTHSGHHKTTNPSTSSNAARLSTKMPQGI